MRLNHVCLVVRDLKTSKSFYQDVIGLTPHAQRDSWLSIGPGSALHLVDIDEDPGPLTLHREVQHFAIEVSDLRSALTRLLDAGLSTFQMDFSGREKQIEAADDNLDFGIGTLFVRDPDENLVELLQPGHGIY